MADLIPRERLQPSLLDRLTDEEPQKQVESRERRMLSVEKLREGVLRDMSWLLNTTNLSAAESLEDHPEIAASVLNYGIPDLTGLTSSSIDVPALERLLRQAILQFEPRIAKRSLQVSVVVNENKLSHNALAFNIQGDLWAHPLPLHLVLRTEVDLECGDFVVTEEQS